MVHEMPAPLQLSRHASVAVARQLILDVANQFSQPLVGEILDCSCRPIVEGASRQFDHLASSSDGAGFGPLTIDELALSLTRRRCGVFLKEVESPW